MTSTTVSKSNATPGGMMDDKELLVLAAKAAGLKIIPDPSAHGVFRDCTGFHPLQNVFAAPVWSPLTDDGDALRLAVKLKMHIAIREDFVAADTPCGAFAEESLYRTDPLDATRRAIVKAAAQLGKTLQAGKEETR